jgi:two-component system, cell cycle sensor histidine kinase and response regulator CckA
MDRRYRILAVDDEYVNTQLIKSALHEEYDILTALDGHEAIALIKQYKPDLILLDVMMPDLSGFEVCRIIRSDAEYDTIPVIFLTALDSQEGQLQGLELGGIDYLTKPVNLALLKLRVRNHLVMKEQRDQLVSQKAELEAALAEMEGQNERQRLADETVRKSKEQLKVIFEASDAGIILVSPTGIIDFANRGMAEMFGMELPELIGTPYSEHLHDSEKLVGNERMNQLIKGEVQSVWLDRRYIRKDGTEFWGHLSGRRLENADGTLRGLVGVISDVSERKRVEEALKESEYRWKFALEGAGDGVWDWNIETGEAFYSQSYKEMLGFDTDEIGNSSDEWLKRIHPEDAPGVLVALQPYLEGKAGTAAVEFRMLCKDGGWKPILGRGMVVSRDSAGKPLRMIGTNTDLTKLKTAEEERRSMELQMLQVQKLESLGVLAGGIAHDFNNILTVIVGNADLALMRLNKESPAVDNLHRIEQAAERAADLARQMLAYSGKGRFVIENINLNTLLEEMLRMLEVSISKKVLLRLNPYQHLPTVEADATQMRQVIMNLVINASEAIGEKSGVIAITTGCMDCDRSYLKDVWLDENSSEGLYVYLEIADSGCGMDKKTMDRLFDPFFTTKFTGRGLGMAAVLGIVRGHKGAIKVYSELNRGTTFKILLPASSKPVEVFNGTSLHDDWQGSGIVLLVDDEETVRGIGTEMLRELGFAVITAADGREGVEQFKNNPDISFVILDLTMPHMDGEQCFRELKQLRPDIKIIMSSGFNEQEVTEKFLGNGLAGFIQKPYKLSVLKEAIRKI